jgi:hypothetical protein
MEHKVKERHRTHNMEHETKQKHRIKEEEEKKESPACPDRPV